MNSAPRTLEEWLHTATAGLERNIRQRLELELSGHYDDAVEELTASGVTPQEAAGKALQMLGDPHSAREVFGEAYAVEMPWDRDFLPRKLPGSDYGYVKGAKLVSCTQAELIEACKGAGINSTEVHLAWTPETEHAVPVEQIPFLFKSIVEKRIKSAQYYLWESAFLCGIITLSFLDLNLRHLSFFLVLGSLLPAICWFKRLREAKVLTPEKLAREVAERQKPFHLWVEMQKSYFTIGLLVVLCALVPLMEIIALPGEAGSTAFSKPFMHAVFNFIGLFLFARPLEVVIGRMFVPVVFLLTASAGFVLSLYLDSEHSVSASGGVLGLAGFLFMLSRRPGTLPLADIPMKVAVAACLTALFGILAYDVFDSAAHLGGLLAGLGLGALTKNPKKLAASRSFQLCGIASCLVLCIVAVYLMIIPLRQPTVTEGQPRISGEPEAQGITAASNPVPRLPQSSPGEFSFAMRSLETPPTASTWTRMRIGV